MSELAALLKKPIEVEVEGVVLRFSRLNDRIRLALEEWAEGMVSRAYHRLATQAPDDAARSRLFGELERTLLDHDYAFGRPKFLELFNTLEGVAVGATELLREHHPGVTKDEVIALLSEYPQVSEGLAKAMRSDSKKKAPPDGA